MEARSPIRRVLADKYGGTEQSTCYYSWHDVDLMTEAGSLFLWHIHREGKILKDEKGALARRLANLVAYSGYSADLTKYRRIFESVRSDLEAGVPLNECDLHALFLVARNCALLGTMWFEDPCFGRAHCLERLRELSGAACGISNETYQRLVWGHFKYSRGLSMEDQHVTDRTAVAEFGLLIDFVEALTNEKVL